MAKLALKQVLILGGDAVSDRARNREFGDRRDRGARACRESRIHAAGRPPLFRMSPHLGAFGANCVGAVRGVAALAGLRTASITPATQRISDQKALQAELTICFAQFWWGSTRLFGGAMAKAIDLACFAYGG
jgi:hypothetical protein